MSHSLQRSFLGFHLTLATVVLLQSAFTVFHAFGGEAATNWPLFILASVEALAAILFLIPATLRLGGIVLCLVFSLAFTAHASIGEFELHLLVYAAGTVFIFFHGSARSTAAK